eukprot:3599180-Ditylum_brightwellii.AAC.1
MINKDSIRVQMIQHPIQALRFQLVLTMKTNMHISLLLHWKAWNGMNPHAKNSISVNIKQHSAQVLHL